MTEIKIFLASSLELKTDREQFEIFIQRKNRELRRRNIFLDLELWEDFSDAMSASGLQSEYNKAVKDSDIFVMLAQNKVGQYTTEEFNNAFKQFLETGSPLIFIYLKPYTTENREDLQSRWAFEDKLNELKHYPTKYRNIEGLKEHFGNQLNRFIAEKFNGVAPKAQPSHYEGFDEKHRALPMPQSEKQNTPTHTQKTIVLLSANLPEIENPYRKREILEIDNAIMRASLAIVEKRNSLPVFKQPFDKSELEADEISKVLSTIEPYIVDISGSQDGLSALLVDAAVESNESENLDALIGDFFKVTSKNTSCVVLNGCYVENQAREIVKHIEFLIGIKHELSHDITITFLNEFYYQLGVGVPISQSYDAACNRIRRRGLDKSDLPVLLNKQQEEQRRALEQELLNVEKKIEEAPERADLRAAKGDLLEKSGEHEKAASAYEKSLHIDGKDYKVWWKQGKALLKIGKYNQAQKPYQNALSLYPEHQDEYVISQEYGLVLSLIEKNRHSLALYKKSLWLNPRYRAASYERKKIYKKIYSGGEQ
jgi:hypothetical protein